MTVDNTSSSLLSACEERHSFHIEVTTGAREHGCYLLHASYVACVEDTPENSSTLVAFCVKLSFFTSPTSLFKFSALRRCNFKLSKFILHTYLREACASQPGVLSYSCWDEKSLSLALKGISEHLQSMKFSRCGPVLLKSPCLHRVSEYTRMVQPQGNVIFLICGEV